MTDFLLKGFVGAIPSIETLKGIQVSKFIISLNGGPVDKPKKIWVRCVAWRELAVLVKEQIFQGDLVGINGRISDVDAWIDQKTKKAKGMLEIRVEEVCKSVRPGEFKNIKPGNERLQGTPEPDDCPF